jgi:hypothetical protein
MKRGRDEILELLEEILRDLKNRDDPQCNLIVLQRVNEIQRVLLEKNKPNSSLPRVTKRDRRETPLIDDAQKNGVMCSGTYWRTEEMLNTETKTVDALGRTRPRIYAKSFLSSQNCENKAHPDFRGPPFTGKPQGGELCKKCLKLFQKDKNQGRI